MKAPIKKQLILLTLLSTFIPLVLLSILFFIFGNKIVIEQAKNINVDKMFLIDQALTIYIEKTKHTINTIANNSLVVNLDTNEIVTYRHWADWNAMMSYHNSITEQKVYEYLKLINLNNPDLGSVYIGTESGRFVMYPPSDRMPFYNPADRPWFKDAKEKKGVIAVTRPFVSSDRNFHVFAVAKYIYFEKSKEYGVVSVNIDLSTITGILSHFNLGNGNYIIVTTEDNTIIANTRDPLSVHKNLDKSNELPEFYKELSTINFHWQDIDVNGNRYFAKKIKSLGTNWTLYSIIDRKIVLTPFKRTFNIFIICSFLILIIFSPILIKYLMYLLTPLKKLSDHLYSLASGDGEALKKKIPLYSPDEVGETIENYNLLLESLNNTFHKILEAKQQISLSNSKLSNQLLIISADITKNLSLIENAEKKIAEIDIAFNTLSADIVKIENSEKSKKSITASLLKEKEEFNRCLKSIIENIYDMKKTEIDMNIHINKSVEYERFMLNELNNISRIINVYKLRSPEKHSEDQENKKGKKD